MQQKKKTQFFTRDGRHIPISHGSSSIKRVTVHAKASDWFGGDYEEALYGKKKTSSSEHVHEDHEHTHEHHDDTQDSTQQMTKAVTGIVTLGATSLIGVGLLGGIAGVMHTI